MSIIAWCKATPTSVSARGSLPRGGSVYDGGDSVCDGVSVSHRNTVCDGVAVSIGECVCGCYSVWLLHHSCANVKHYRNEAPTH